jgi:hypothetical protein
MPKLAGRGVFIAALAVPIAMVVAPLAASAEELDAVATDQAQTAAVTPYEEAGTAAYDDWYLPDNVDVVDYDADHESGPEANDNQVTYQINGIHNDSVTGNYESNEGDDVDLYNEQTDVDLYNEQTDIDLYNEQTDIDYVDHHGSCGHVVENSCGDEDTDVVNEDEDVYVVDEDEVTDEDAIEGEEAPCEDDVDASPMHGTYTDEDVTASDEDDYVVYEDDDVFGAGYSDTNAGAGPEGAWVSSTDSGAFSSNSNYGDAFSDNGTATYYEGFIAAAGIEGAYVQSTESGAGEYGGLNADGTGAYSESHGAGAGAGAEGAWVAGYESGATTLN